MIRVCAWCRHLLGAPGPAGSPITHGICDPCAERWLADDPHAGMEQLEGAVLLIESSGRILDTNRRACDMLDQQVPRGRMLGEAARCLNAALPGGCGHTTHCSQCELRGIFEHTARTGAAREGARAEIPRSSPSVLTVTTERVSTAVLVRIDDLDESPR